MPKQQDTMSGLIRATALKTKGEFSAGDILDKLHAEHPSIHYRKHRRIVSLTLSRMMRGGELELVGVDGRGAGYVYRNKD